MSKLVYGKEIENLLMIQEKATEIMLDKKYANLAEAIGKKKTELGTTFQDWFELLIQWANEFEFGNYYNEDDGDYIDAIEMYATKKLEEFAAPEIEYQPEFRFTVVAKNEKEAYEIIKRKLDAFQHIADLVYFKEANNERTH